MNLGLPADIAKLARMVGSDAPFVLGFEGFEMQPDGALVLAGHISTISTLYIASMIFFLRR